MGCVEYKKWNEKIFLILGVLFILLNIVSAQEKEIFIEIKIEPAGVITTDYNVVGDVFSYNISLYNNNSENFEDVISVEVYGPNNKNLSNNIFSYPINIKPYTWHGITPNINLSESNNTYIWSFDVAGDYQIKICSLNPNTKFIMKYSFETGKFQGYKSSYWYYSCFPDYFSAMPKWQYDLFKKENAAAQESLDASKKSLEANQKIVDLTVDLDKATKSMLFASVFMVFVAIASLYIACLKEDDKRGKLYNIIKFLSIVGVVVLIILIILWIIYLIFELFLKKYIYIG